MTNYFHAGGVLSRSINTWLQNLIPFTLISIILSSPVIIWTVVVLEKMEPNALETWGTWSTYAEVMTHFLIMGAVVFGVYERLRGNQPSVGDCISQGFSRLIPVMGVVIATIAFVTAGFFALIIPGLIINTMLWVAIPAAVTERGGVFAALRRSIDLTKGYRWSVFGVIIVTGILTTGPALILKRVMLNDSLAPAEHHERWVALKYAFLGLNTFLASLAAVIPAVGYYELRRAKEGLDLGELADVFS